ncbi:hypothetical protein N431DRAFT_474014 [Stipitochalara longipes BDJ]|nr:hypothetical protein N431DRAFT_474014 [Stipitochalara longipes BDJ]
MDSAENVNSSRKRQRSSSLQLRSRDDIESSACSAGGRQDGNSNRGLVSSKGCNPKANTACETCRLKKVKCNEGQPICNYCKTHGFRCDYRRRLLSRHEQLIAELPERLAYVEEQLKTVLQLEQKQGPRQAHTAGGGPVLNAAIATQSSLEIIDHSQSDILAESSFVIDRAASDPTPRLFSGASVKSRYLAKSPFTYEEDRLPLSDFNSHTQSTKSEDIMPWLEYYLEHTFPMYPVMCDPSAHKVSGMVEARGFGENIESCFTLLIVALSKSYRNENCPESGVSDFQRAVDILRRVSTQFRMTHIQAHVLSALFLLKKGRLLDFWSSLHMGCTMLYTMLRRDQTTGTERSIPEKMNLRRIYWICYNLERDVKNEIDETLPQSSLHELEDTLPLPLGCDELDLSHLPIRIRTMLTFFLAEMSLKAIAERIFTTADEEFYVQDIRTGSVDVSPLCHELRRQLDEWVGSVPSFLGWSSELMRGVSSPLGIRVKLMYWFVRFSLFRPLIQRILHDSNSCFPIHGWTLFREGLHAGLNLINVSILEQSDIDVFMGNRIISTICLIKETVDKGYFPVERDQNVSAILQAGIDVLWSQLAVKSEWIKCRLYGLQEILGQ